MPSPRASNKSGTSSSMGINNTTQRSAETPKDLKKRVNALNKSLASVHDRLIQTEKQIFDLERSYLEETRLYGNVLQGWDAYLESKGKGKGGDSLGIKRARKDAVDTYVGTDDAGEFNAKRAKGVELQERLFSLGSVTSPAAKGIQKQEDKAGGRRSSGRQGDAGSSGAGSSSSVAGSSSPKKSPKSAKMLKTPKDKKTLGKGTAGVGAAGKRTGGAAGTGTGGAAAAAGAAATGGSRSGKKDRDSARKESMKRESAKKKKKTR